MLKSIIHCVYGQYFSTASENGGKPAFYAPSTAFGKIIFSGFFLSE
jgi:hypothetical protein